MDGRFYLRSDYGLPLRWVTAFDSEIGSREQGFCPTNVNETFRIGDRLGFPYNTCHVSASPITVRLAIQLWLKSQVGVPIGVFLTFRRF